jgi:hypothetical protein
MNTFEIKVQRTYETTIKVDAEDIDNAYELMSGGAFEDTINTLELEQCNIIDTDYQIEETFKHKTRLDMETTRTKLLAMCNGEIIDIVLSNGVLKINKQIDKVNDNLYQIHSFTDGWTTADLTLDEAVDYCDGKINNIDLNWY